MDGSKKQIALVTGASRGIGRAIAIALGKTGRHVLINYLSREEDARETLLSIERNGGGSGELLPFDVANFQAVEQGVHSAVENHGKIDIIVNNAGIRKDMLLAWMEPPDWQKVLDTNLSSFFNLTRLVIKDMMHRRWGRIINISSTSGQTGMAGQVNYSASKAGLIGATQALSKEVARRRVTVNAIAPGFTETEMLSGLPLEDIVKTIPMKRLGKPEEVAALAVFLCSEEASYITGQVIGINGGIC